MIEPVVVFVFVLNFFSLLLNVFGIYCLHMQRGGNANQRILLQNLSAIEIVKIINDYVSMSLYYVNNGLYLRNAEFLDIIEANILTVFFCSVMLISAERVACVMLNLKYFTYVRESLVQNTVFTTWIVGCTSGLFI